MPPPGLSQLFRRAGALHGDEHAAGPDEGQAQLREQVEPRHRPGGGKIKALPQRRRASSARA